MTSSNSSLGDAAQAAVETVRDAYRGFPWANRRAYGDWLVQTYSFVRYATRLLSQAAARCSLAEQALHEKLVRGIQEEAGHDQLALDDLAQLGLARDEFSELPETAAYYQSLYFAIDHDGPTALLGYFLPLEGMAALYGQAELDAVCAAHSPRAATFLQLHCQADVAHFGDSLKFLDALFAQQQSAVQKNLQLSAALYSSILREIRRRSS